ncbi:ParB N-terminal domain-containing protein [Seohaeicola saemankumensis]|uniref:ParB/RepB/Spo0J family partition protein n=1 Tax=Seohaeicola saemankumensis TaxID=481181 RepID=UPI001E62F0E4|nr:ParB N-terminal domain-containing protein [Seohaeicola saemankumensis]MCD1627378.1 ParB N-terminal domain-containing protein [Seohaeicola saemankumensis]
MAKRKRLEAPSADALKEIEEGFARETSATGPLGPMPPIAQIASEAAAGSSPLSSDERLRATRDSADAARFRRALEAGLIVQEIRVIDIRAEALSRDRMTVSREEMEELKTSIRAHGLRLPIEVFEEPPTSENGPVGYAVISGWRRLMAYRELMSEGGDEFLTIKALVRSPASAADAYVAMVEENEIRSDLSHYERGRVAVMATSQGAFVSVEDAVNALFHAGSKAKRSKIRAFAELHEELGDLLNFAPNLSERQGLRLVGAIRSGMAPDLRRTLGAGVAQDAASEWAMVEPVVLQAESLDKPQKSPGRPRIKPPMRSEFGDGYYKLANGITMMRDSDTRGHYIRLEGHAVNIELIDVVMLEIQRLLERV